MKKMKHGAGGGWWGEGRIEERTVTHLHPPLTAAAILSPPLLLFGCDIRPCRSEIIMSDRQSYEAIAAQG